MLKLARTSLALALIPAFLSPISSLAQDEHSQKRCLRILSEEPTRWTPETETLSTNLMTNNPEICPYGVSFNDPSPIHTTWNGRRVVIHRGLCNDRLPILRVNVDREPHYIYIVNLWQRRFSWNQALTLGCHSLATNPADRGNWRLPSRHQRAYFKFMIAAGADFFDPIATYTADSGKKERIFATFVEEKTPQESLACYQNTFTGFAFFENFLASSPFPMRDEDFKNRSRQSVDTMKMTVDARDQAIRALLRYSLGGQPLPDSDEARNRAVKEHIKRSFDERDIARARDLYTSLGESRADEGLALATQFILTARKPDGSLRINWMKILNNEKFLKEMTDRMTALATILAGRISLNYDVDKGGGLPVYCITEGRKPGAPY